MYNFTYNTLEVSFTFTHQGVKNNVPYHLALAYQCNLEKYIEKNKNSSNHENFIATYMEVLQVMTVIVISQVGVCT